MTRAPWLLAPLLLALAFVAGTCFRSDAPSTGGSEVADTDIHTCSMHPQIRHEGPGSCPICGMDLIPLGASPALGPTEVALDERAAALAQLRTAPVRRSGGGSGARRALVARVALDEASARDVTAWIGGRVDRLLVRETGQQVRRGQTVATVFSPEVLAAHRDVRAARDQLARLEAGTLPHQAAHQAAQRALEAARDRLRLLGFEGAALERLEDSDGRRVPVRSTASGTVVERVVTQGQYVQPGAVLLRVASLDPLWVELDAYAADLASLSVGAPVTLRFHGAAPIEAEVSFVDPVVDPRTHVARVRVEVPNPDGDLRPGMVGEASLRADTSGPGALVVPRTAPLHTGRRALVYVQDPARAHHYEAREVLLGATVGEDVIVRAGLEDGERVVTHGAFVLDAELEIRGGESMMTRPGDVAPLADEDAAAWRAALEASLRLAERLAADDLAGARAAAGALAEAAEGAAPLADLAAAARQVADAADVDAARAAFESATGATEDLLARHGNPLETPVRRAMCPMAFDNRGATWIQRGDVVDNPYFGDLMRTCGSIERTFEPAEAPEPPEPPGPASMAATGMRSSMRSSMRASPMAPASMAPASMDTAAMSADPHAHHHHGGS